MRQLTTVLFLCAVLSSAALAQRQEPPHKGQEYLFFAPTGISNGDFSHTFLHVGGGGEGYLSRHFGVGGELGYLWPQESRGTGIGILSVNGLFDFTLNCLRVFVSGKQGASDWGRPCVGARPLVGILRPEPSQ